MNTFIVHVKITEVEIEDTDYIKIKLILFFNLLAMYDEYIEK